MLAFNVGFRGSSYHCKLGQTNTAMIETESHSVVPKFKVIILGEVGVGKTSFFLRVRDGQFKEGQAASLGVDNCTCMVKAGGQMIQLTLWDTAGVERFRTLTRNFYRNAHAILMTFSMDDPSSLYQLSKWEQDARTYAPKALHFLMGTKIDLERVVKQEAVEGFARTHNAEYAFLCSAKSGRGIPEVLATVTEKLVKVHAQQKHNLENSWLDHSIHVTSNGNQDDEKPVSGCCGGSRS